MLHSVQLIVLHTIKYTESSLLVYAYTHLFGRQTYLVRGVRSAKNRNAAAYFFPLQLLEAEVYYKSGANMQYIKEYRPKNPLQGIRTNLYKSAIALFLGELLYKTIKEEEPDALLFQFISDSIHELDACTERVANFHLHFITHYCAHLGFAPHINFHPQHTPLFYIPHGSFVPVSAISDLTFSMEESSLLVQLYTMQHTPSAASISLHSTQRHLYIQAIVRYLSYHLNSSLELTSPKVLMQIFQ